MLWLTKDVSIRLLARTAGHTWVGCCSSRTVHNSESLRGLRCTLQERRDRGKARALLGPLTVRTYRTGVKALLCPKPCGRIGRERRLCRVKAMRTSGQEWRLCRVKAVRTSGRERRLCRVKAVRTRAKALSGQSRADERTRANGTTNIIKIEKAKATFKVLAHLKNPKIHSQTFSMVFCLCESCLSSQVHLPHDNINQ